MGLSAIELLEAEALLNDTSKSKTDRVRDFYSYIDSKGEDYGRLGLGVTDNNTWQGQIANGFVVSGADNNGGGFEVGSTEWIDLNFDLANRHFQAYDDAGGATPVWQDIQDYHNDAYNDAGLDANDWFPNKILNDTTDPGATWADWQSNDNALDVWEDTIEIAEAGGKLLYGPQLLGQGLTGNLRLWTH